MTPSSGALLSPLLTILSAQGPCLVSRLHCFVLQDDPLEAFMAEINQTNQSEAAAVPAEKKSHLELDEDADHVADFLEVCPNTHTSPLSFAAAVAATPQRQ